MEKEPLPERERSLVHDFESEWRKRPVNVMKVFKSLVNQLTDGADLTRISMPSEICHPFSALEVVAGRELNCFSDLFVLNDHPNDPWERFLCVARWVISCFPREEIEKKPFNPTIGEEHMCWIEYDKDDWTELVSEQVSHHPPLTAFFVRNKKRNLNLTGTLDFGVSFGGANHTVITSGGGGVLSTQFEEYNLSKLVPNLIIRRVIFGVKYYMWDGPFVVECPTNGFKLELNFSEKSESNNQIKGSISIKGQIAYHISGSVGKLVYFWKPEDKKEKKKKRQVLYDFSNLKRDDSVLKYPPPECRVAMNSLRLWKDVADAVIRDDMYAADVAKRKVEHEQRLREKKREAEGASYNGVYFESKQGDDDTTLWSPKEGAEVSLAVLESLKEKAAKQREEEKERLAKESSLHVHPGDLLSKSEVPHSELDHSKLKKDEHRSKSTDSALRNSKKEGEEDENCIIS